MSDWPDSVHTTGYWFLPPSDEALPPRVEDFLGAGDPPVFVGFGSMSAETPRAPPLWSWKPQAEQGHAW